MAGNSAGRGDRSYKPAQLSSILSPATGSDAEVERHLAFNQDQEGSSPSAPTNGPVSVLFPKQAAVMDDAGSNPVGASIIRARGPMDRALSFYLRGSRFESARACQCPQRVPPEFPQFPARSA